MDRGGESAKSALGHAPLKADWREVPGLVEHTFTHFHLELSVYRAEVAAEAKLDAAAQPERCRWLHVRELYGAALPSGDAQGPRPRARREALALRLKLRRRAASRKASIGLSLPFAS